MSKEDLVVMYDPDSEMCYPVYKNTINGKRNVVDWDTPVSLEHAEEEGAKIINEEEIEK